MHYLDIVAELAAGRSVTYKGHGNSMTPLIRSGQPVILSPIAASDVEVGDAVLAKVKGRFFVHKVTAIGDDGRFQISNNHGHVNGWTRQVYGKVTEIL